MTTPTFLDHPSSRRLNRGMTRGVLSASLLITNLSSCLLLVSFVLLSNPTTTNLVESKSVFTTLLENFFSTSRKDAVNHTAIYHLDDHEKTHLTLPRVWLTVASIVDVDHNSTDYRNTSVVRALEIHWQASGDYGPTIGDCIELYDLRRSQPFQQSPIRRYILRDSKNRLMNNYIKTDVEFPSLNETEIDQLVETKDISPYDTKHGKLSGRCMHYYAVYVSSTEPQTIKSLYCIRLNSRWMEEELHLLTNRTLTEVMLPGTHDSSAFEPYDLVDYEGNVLTRFQYTQDESLYSQLAHGIRYLDMRVGAYNVTDSGKNITQPDGTSKPFFLEQLWMVHDVQRNDINLSQALEQIRRFMRRTTHEVVIVDFHRFVNGFDTFWDFDSVDQRLRHFYTLIVKHLGSYILPFAENHNTTIDEMIRTNRRVIIGYAYKYDKSGHFDSDLFWPPVEHLWPNTDKMAQLKSYIAREICSRRPASSGGHLRSMMAELTPNLDGIVFRRYHGLRGLATLTNSYYDLWFRRKYWTCTNVVAADYFLGSDIVQIAIDVNRRRFQPRTSRQLYNSSQAFHL